jgi:DNA-binding MarR family transcriptional regulator
MPKKPPYLYSKIAELLNKDTGIANEIKKDKVIMLLSRNFRISKSDTKKVIDEMQKMGFIKKRTHKEIVVEKEHK